jgi:hypothetical protein
MALPRRPAALLPAAAPSATRAAALAAARRGWPRPAVYAGADGLEQRRAAVTAGRHDAVLMPAATAAGAMRRPDALVALLAACTAAGVPVSVAPLAPAPEPEPDTLDTRAILDQAAHEALAAAFPDWRIWADDRGWHARRQAGDGYVQSRQAGTPVYHVSAPGAVSLAAQLLWQQAADRHTPNGCTAARGDGPGRAPGHGQVTRAS